MAHEEDVHHLLVMPPTVQLVRGHSGVHAVMHVVLRGSRNEPDIRHELKNVVEDVHTRYLISDHVIDMHVRMVEPRSVVDALALQVGQEPAVSMIKMNAQLVGHVSIIVQMFLAVIPVAVILVIQKLELNVSCGNARLVDVAIDTVMSIQITSVRNVRNTTKHLGETTMLYHAAIIICVRRMIDALTEHAQGHRSLVLNVNAVMEVDARSNLISV